MSALYFIKKKLITPVSRSVRMKYLLFTGFIVLLPLILATLISWNNSKYAVEKDIIEKNISTMNWVADDVGREINRIEETLSAFFFDGNVRFYMDRLESNTVWQSEAISFFKTKLNAYLLANYPDFRRVHFTSVENLKKISVSIEYEFMIEGIKEERLPSMVYSRDNHLVFEFLEVEGTQVPSFGKPYYRFEDQKLIGILQVELNNDMFFNRVELLKMGTDSDVWIIDKNKNIMYWTGTGEANELIGTLTDVEELKEYEIINNYYVFSKKLLNDVYIVKAIPRRTVSSFYIRTLAAQLFLIFMAGALLFYVVVRFGNRLINPLTKLTKSMQDIDGILDGSDHMEPSVRSNDEIKVLEQSYLMMTSRIKELINTEYKHRIALQESHLMALQAQINPHFMYNTLQMIGSMAIEKSVPEIYEIVNDFGKMMHYKIRQSEEPTTLRDEIDNMIQYVRIQKKRFGEKLNVVININEHLLDVTVPKLMLQPIVENSFQHGFVNESRNWMINIDAALSDERLILTIRDNSVGISDEQLNLIREKLSRTDSMRYLNEEHIGIRNIDSRIKLLYGSEYGVYIESDQGAIVRVMIPNRIGGDKSV